MFLSTITNKIDKKGRVSVPAQFRTYLSQQEFPGLVLFRSIVHPILEGCGYNTLMKLSQAEEMAALSPHKEHDYAALMFAEAQMLSFDSEGRVTIPAEFLGYANIQEQMTFVGRGARFEIWQPEHFEMHHQGLRQRFAKQITNEGA